MKGARDSSQGGEQEERQDSPSCQRGLCSERMMSWAVSDQPGRTLGTLRESPAGRWSPSLDPGTWWAVEDCVPGAAAFSGERPAWVRPPCSPAPHLPSSFLGRDAAKGTSVSPDASFPQPHPMSCFSCRPPRKIFFFLLNYYEFLFFSQEQDPIETRLWKKRIGGLLRLSLTLPKHGFSQASLTVARLVPRGTDPQPSSHAWDARGWRPLRGCESLRASLPAASQLPMKFPASRPPLSRRVCEPSMTHVILEKEQEIDTGHIVAWHECRPLPVCGNVAGVGRVRRDLGGRGSRTQILGRRSASRRAGQGSRAERG